MAKYEEAKAKMDEDEEMASDDFDSGSESGLSVICNMIYVLSLEYDTVIEVFEEVSGLYEKNSNPKTIMLLS